jgi:phage tail tape-measure protein
VAADFQSSIVIKAVDQASKVMARIGVSAKKLEETLKNNEGLANFNRSLKVNGQILTNLTNGMITATTAVAAAGAVVVGAGVAFTKTAMNYENLKMQLETTEGSTASAKKAFEWIQVFAAKTPYQLNEVASAFVRLRSYGLTPTNGLLRTLGDTASSLGKPMMMAVEMISDAIVGENERLKEFGIRAKKEGENFRYTYINNQGVEE